MTTHSGPRVQIFEDQYYIKRIFHTVVTTCVRVYHLLCLSSTFNTHSIYFLFVAYDFRNGQIFQVGLCS
jgi:hypothetical protein